MPHPFGVPSDLGSQPIFVVAVHRIRWDDLIRILQPAPLEVVIISTLMIVIGIRHIPRLSVHDPRS